MKPFYVIDSHCDTIGKIADSGANLHDASSSHLTIEGLRQGNVGLQFFAVWSGTLKTNGPPLKRCFYLIDAYLQMLKAHEEVIRPILQFEDIKKTIDLGRIGALLTTEGGEVLEGEIAHLRLLYALGVRGLTLTWNYRNELADGVLDSQSKGGLSSFGYKVVQEMNRLGMVVDVSHISEVGFWDTLEASTKPVVATHSNAKAVWDHKRNLTDEQILAIKEKEGYIGINFYPVFLAKESASLRDILSHIEHITAIAGVEVIGFGSDFDGIDSLPIGICGPQGYTTIIEALLTLNYTEAQVRKIACENILRVLKNIL